jgi:hypothetical protein
MAKLCKIQVPKKSFVKSAKKHPAKSKQNYLKRGEKYDF